MGIFGWSYPAGVTSTPYDDCPDDTICFHCGGKIPERAVIPMPFGGVDDAPWWDAGFCCAQCMLNSGLKMSHPAIVRHYAKKQGPSARCQPTFTTSWDNGNASGSLFGEYDNWSDANYAGEDWYWDMVAIDPDPERAMEAYHWDVHEHAPECPNCSG